jgi:hypothetical protein
MDRIEINFDKIKDIAMRGIRRTTIFLGLGVNAARDNKLTTYQLSENVHLRLVPEQVSEDELLEFKSNFEKWIISNGLRELIESFGVFLDRIHQASLWFAIHKGLISPEDANKFGPAFEKKGVEGKLNKLRTRFNIFTDRDRYFPSINQARNCITHRRSLVGVEDLKGHDTLQLIWWAFDFIALFPDGKEVPLMPLPEGGFYFENGGKISLKIRDRIREYNIGEVIELTPVDVNEICYLVMLATDEIVASTVNYAKSIGIEVTEPSGAREKSP